jgi:hypothetical protein
VKEYLPHLAAEGATVCRLGAGVVAICAHVGDIEGPENFGRMVHFVRHTGYGEA